MKVCILPGYREKTKQAALAKNSAAGKLLAAKLLDTIEAIGDRKNKEYDQHAGHSGSSASCFRWEMRLLWSYLESQIGGASNLSTPNSNCQELLVTKIRTSRVYTCA